MALLGTLAAAAASDGNFGNEPTQFGNSYYPQFGYQPQFGDDAHPALMAPPPPPAPPAAPMTHPGHLGHAMHGRPNPHDPRWHGELLASWHREHGRDAHTRARVALLDPNAHSNIKVEAYVFSLNPTQFSTGTSLTWGTLNGWTAFKNPQVPFRAERIFVNVTCPGLVYLNAIQAANVNAQIGGVADGFTFSPYAMGSKISLPTLPPQNTMQVTGTWTNVVPTPFNAETEFTLCIDFEGWATVIA
jgi:hypothetical protein